MQDIVPAKPKSFFVFPIGVCAKLPYIKGAPRHFCTAGAFSFGLGYGRKLTKRDAGRR